MHNGELAATSTDGELETIRARMRVTIAMLDKVIADRCERGLTVEQISAGGTVLLLKHFRHEA